MDRGQVIARGLNGGFHLAGIFASFPSDLDGEIKRLGTRIHKFKKGDNQRYSQNRDFVYRFLMEQSGFAIQVGAFGDERAAARLAGELRAVGYSAYVRRGDGPRGARFRVRVGPVPSREEAARLASKLKSDQQLPTWILSPESR
jgi:hypothetical protein